MEIDIETVEYQARTAVTQRSCAGAPCTRMFPYTPSRWCSYCLIAALLGIDEVAAPFVGDGAAQPLGESLRALLHLRTERQQLTQAVIELAREIRRMEKALTSAEAVRAKAEHVVAEQPVLAPHAYIECSKPGEDERCICGLGRSVAVHSVPREHAEQIAQELEAACRFKSDIKDLDLISWARRVRTVAGLRP